ncbi:MAG TPA: gamma-glutamyltransferase, partial [Gemmataceae bacterium]|nr:gamma-glutamyltransferase [Gemmataceae bacterium]
WRWLPALALAAALPAAAAEERREGPSATGTRGMVVSVSRPATEVGVATLKAGGNAVDAAVATAFALAVTWPEAGNIGGGGFMLVHPPAGKPILFDYRETAPAAATRDMFARVERPSPYLLVGTPGTVRGLALAHQRFGKLPWKDLVLPAVRLASDGFAIDAPLAASLNGVLRRSRSRESAAELRRVYGKDGSKTPWKAGDRLTQPDLAKTLRRVAEGGPDAFYAGETADLIAAEMKRGGGILTQKDLADYRAKEREPIHGTYRGYDVYGPPPPSSGGIALIEMLNTLEGLDLRKRGRHSAETAHLMIEAMRRAYRDRAAYLGDPDFVKVPAFLTAKEYAKRQAAKIDTRKATPSADLAGDIPLSAAAEGSNTTHFSVIDGGGMAVANTYTLESSFGSRVVVRGAGFLLNDEMGDFNPRPGVTDRRGRIGTAANEVAPGKRMLSSMTPTVVAKDGKPVLVTGSPGGRTILNTVLCVVLNVLEFDLPVREAVDAPRLHQGWFPDVVEMERGLREDRELVRKLEAMGHKVAPRPVRQGDAHTIRIDSAGRYEGAADRRRSGWAAGY